MRRSFAALLVGSLAVTCSCAAARHDYAPYRSHMPRSILVLPPLNQSTDVNAPYVYLSTVSRPLAECGYYVFPVAVVDAFMKDNGLPTAGEMHDAPLDKIREFIGADAVLYATIEEWGQKYMVLMSTTVVKIRAQLIDVASGTTIWSADEAVSEGSGGAEGGLIGMAVAAAIEQIVDSMTDRTHGLSRQANHAMVFNENDGLLFGHYHPGYEADTRGR